MPHTRVAFESARLRLARYRVQGRQSCAQAAAHVAQVSAEALGVERVGVWLFQDDGARLVCESQYVRSTKQHGSGTSLASADYPRYMRALHDSRVIAADDARTHEAMSELVAGYLEPHGISSMLDAPIIRGGQVIGVVCHEHVGEPRHWTQKDLAFASSVADMMTLVLEQAERLELEAVLQSQSAQSLEQQKMEALGRMANAVAHDVNNLLATIQLTVTMLAKTAPPHLREHVEDVMTSIELGRRLTQQLMTFGRKREEHPGVPVDLRALLARMEPMMRTALGRAIALSIDVEAEEPRVLGDPPQLEQALLTLALSARDSIERDGEIAIIVREPREDDEAPASHLVLEVRDTGAGMEEAARARVFEPFFDAHGQGVGAGFGLAGVYGIVQRAGGVIRALSAPGRGTSIVLALPRATVS